MFPSTCDIYRPFGAGSPTQTGIQCRLVPDMFHGQRLGGGNLGWTHYLELAADADIRDGCSRRDGDSTITFTDGDEIRIGTTRYAVVWVEPHDRDGMMAFRRAYLLRHDVTWPTL
jgi:hypothetical protein